MIFKIELQGDIQELCWFPTITDAITDLICRNERAGREVLVTEQRPDSVQFSLVYPELDRRIDGTICRYGMGGRLPIDPSDILEDVERLTQEGKTRREICRILSCSTSVMLNAKRINKIRQHLGQHAKIVRERLATQGNL